jgi:hypothetical protein
MSTRAFSRSATATGLSASPRTAISPCAVAEGKGPQTSVREVMSNEVKYCFEDDDTRDVAHNMAEIQVRRLPLINRDKRLIGIIALGDIALTEGGRPAGEALSGISELGGSHSQTGRERT